MTLDNQEIKRLIQATARRGDGCDRAFALLYRRCAPMLLGAAMRLVRRRELAEEILHDGFVRVWRQAASFDPARNHPIAWMIAIVRNRAIDVLESHDVARVSALPPDAAEGTLDALFDWTEGPEQDLDRAGSARVVRKCLEGLPAVERQSLVLAYAHGMSHSDLAAHLMKPLGTVKGWVRRGLDNLRRCVERYVERGA